MAAGTEKGYTVEALGTEGEWTRVTFAEKPERSIINALKASGFRWSNASWIGPGPVPEVLR